jgi:hypothetical protein
VTVNDDAALAEGELSAALDGWVAAFDREMEQTGDFAMSVGAMTAHGCFDVRTVVERWVVANPIGDVIFMKPQPALQEPELLELPQPEPEVSPEPEEALTPPEPAWEAQRTSPRIQPVLSPDIAYFHSLLQGGIDRALIDEAFPGFEAVIDEAVGQFEASAPILSDVPKGPTREDLNDEIRGMRKDLQASGTRGRRRWRARD